MALLSRIAGIIFMLNQHADLPNRNMSSAKNRSSGLEMFCVFIRGPAKQLRLSILRSL